MSEFIGSKGFFSCNNEGLKTGFHYGNGRVRDDWGKSMGFISHHEIEQGLVCDGVRVVVVGEFNM